jgi:hypothetical protein
MDAVGEVAPEPHGAVEFAAPSEPLGDVAAADFDERDLIARNQARIDLLAAKIDQLEGLIRALLAGGSDRPR